MSEIIKQIFFDLGKHKLRTFLALFGIVWGTAAVILLVALGDGFYSANKKSLEAISQNAIYILPGATSKNFQGLGIQRPILIYPRDIENLPARIPGVLAVSPILSTTVTYAYQQKNLSNTLNGVSPGYLYQNIHVSPGGRFINALDIQNKTFTVFLGDQLAKSLFGPENPVGQTLLINHLPMTVIGVASSDSEGTLLNNTSAANSGFMPYTTYELLTGDKNLSFFVVIPKQGYTNHQIVQALRDYFGHLLHFDPSDENALNIPDTGQFTAFLTWFFYGIRLFLGFCGFMTLAVGGLGIANTLFLIVSERTAEIGLRLALGARDYHILGQVLLESLLLVLTGGFIGLSFAILIINLINLLPLGHVIDPLEIHFLNFIITLTILLLIALLAGYFPAKKAAELTPVEALAF